MTGGEPGTGRRARRGMRQNVRRELLQASLQGGREKSRSLCSSVFAPLSNALRCAATREGGERVARFSRLAWKGASVSVVTGALRVDVGDIRPARLARTYVLGVHVPWYTCTYVCTCSVYHGMLVLPHQQANTRVHVYSEYSSTPKAAPEEGSGLCLGARRGNPHTKK
jgi:hypothetical protein